MTFNLYIKGKYKEAMEQLEACSKANDRTYSSAICKAVQFYMDNMETLKPNNKEVWDKYIKTANREQLLELNTFICGMNEVITKKCQI